MSLERRHLVAGLVLIAVALAAVYVAFVRSVPGGGDEEIHAVFESSGGLTRGSDVRVSGLRIGSVSGIERDSGGRTRVTLKLEDSAVDIHSDARLAIRPRLALEGNYFVDVEPGSPGAAALGDGATIPAAQTALAVQLDQVLGVLERPTRDSLNGVVHEFSTGLGAGPGGSGYAGLRAAVRELDRSLGSVRQAARAVQGTRPGDLGRALRSTGDTTSQLAASPTALAALVTNYNQVFGALADNDVALGASVRELARLFRTGPQRLAAIDAALPRLTTLARALEPSLDVAPRALRRTNRALEQFELVSRPQELPELLRSLRPVTAELPTLNRRLGALFPIVTSAFDCVSRNVVGTLNSTIEDGQHTTGQKVWLETLHFGASLASIAQGFDGNGTTLRLGVTENERAVTFNLPGVGRTAGTGQPTGVSPTWLGFGVDPPYRPDTPCLAQKLPDLNVPSRRGGPPTMTPADGTPSAAARALRTALAGGKSDAALRALRELAGSKPKAGDR